MEVITKKRSRLKGSVSYKVYFIAHGLHRDHPPALELIMIQNDIWVRVEGQLE